MKGKVNFIAVVKKFGNQGEKTGWTYIEVDSITAGVLNPGVKKSYRVKGTINGHKISQTALIPMGGGAFIIPVNGTMRKETGIIQGDEVDVKLQFDNSDFTFDPDLLNCLKDDKVAKRNFEKFPPSHRKYFSKWISDAKTQATKTKRIAMAVNALAAGMNYAEMLRSAKKSG